MSNTFEIDRLAATDSRVATLAFEAKNIMRWELRLWCLATGEELYRGPAPRTVGAMVAAPTQREILLAASTKLDLVDVESGARRAQLPTLHRRYDVLDASYAVDGSALAVMTAGHCAVIDARTHERVVLDQAKSRRAFTCCALSPDGTELAIAVYRSNARQKSIESWLEIYRVPELQLDRRVTCEIATTLDWTSRGIFLGTSQGLQLYAAESVTVMEKGRVRPRRAFSADGGWLASVATRGDQAARLEIQAEGWPATAIYEGQKGPVRTAQIALACAGTRLICGRGSELAAWDCDSGTRLWSANCEA
jgi:hypothetical protein